MSSPNPRRTLTASAAVERYLGLASLLAAVGGGIAIWLALVS